jgi:hypothetical protein
MHYFLGTLALLGVGFIGLLIEIHKQDKQKIKDWRAEYERVVKENSDLYIENKTLIANQKPVPWNKGKKGYKLTRKPKEVTYVLNTEQPVIAAWDKDGNQTVSPNWENIG